MSTQSQQLWADTPFNLIPIPGLGKRSQDLGDAEFLAQDMANAHNNLLRSLNAIYNQAPFVTSTNDIQDFLQYCQFWCLWIAEHHSSEEKFLFPWIEEEVGVPGLMEANVKQHDAFHDGLEEFEKYAKETKIEDYNATEMRKVIDSFGAIFTQHLQDEIGTLLGLDQYGEHKWREIYERFVKVIQKDAQFALFPLVLGASDNSVMAWPHLPFFVPYLCYVISLWKYAGVWRFSPSTVFGTRRQLAFTGRKS